MVIRKRESKKRNIEIEKEIKDESLIKIIKREEIGDEREDPRRNIGYCNARLDWESIRNDYISGWYNEITGEYIYPTYEKLAEKYNCAMTTICKKGSEENWNKMRVLLKSKIKERRTYNEIKEVIGIAAKFDSEALESISDSYEILRTYLNIAKKAVIENELSDEEIINSEIPNNIMKVTNSLEKLVNINKKILMDDTNHKSLQNELKELKEELTKEIKGKEEENEMSNLIDMQKRLEEIQLHRKEILSKKKLKDGSK